jgi:SNF2 family DNA or RNA helicase
MTQPLKLYDFQQEAVDRLAKQKSRLIAHDMGLGKTVQGVELDRINRQECKLARLKTLIVTPRGVIDDGAWQKAIRSQLGTSVPVYVIDRKNRAAFERVAADSNIEGIFICHWESLRLMPLLRKVKWFHIIADEVHRAKSRKSQQTVALKKLHTEYKTGLSGTWADNLPQDAWSVLNWLWPSYYRSYWNFVRHYCISEQIVDPRGEKPTYTKVTGVQNTESLNREMAPWYDRKLKEDVLKDLPEKYNTAMWVDLSPTQRRSYNEMKEELIAWIGRQDHERPLVASVVVAQLVRLQQFCIASAEITGYVEKPLKDKNTGEVMMVTVPVVKMTDPSAKLDRVMELLEDTALDSEPVVIFSQFKGAIRMLEERCRKAKISVATFTGDTKDAERREAIAGFQAGKYQVFAATIAAGGEGITLTRASTVVFLDRAWSPSKNRQAEDRLHRIGQKNAVQVIDIMARNTIDFGRRQQIEQKWSWLEQILGDK